jgi:DNA mismatch repair protein MutS
MDAALGPPDKMVERQEELTPMMAQYFELCEAYDDALVLFQVGDFYEAFCEAAETVARTCEITLTKREDSTGKYAMAGVPIDNAESFIERLLDAGYLVAVADQVQEPAEATGVVDRAVTRVITPGTLTEVELLDGDDNTYVAALAASGGVDGSGGEDAGLGVTGETYAVAVLDVSTGDFYATSGDRAVIADELGRFAPAEAIVGPDASADVLAEECVVSPCDPAAFERDRARERVGTYFGTPERLLAGGAEIRACGALLAYAEYARGGEERLGYLNHLTRYDPRDYMLLDAVALDSLELFERRAVRGREEATLVETVDETASALGRRKLDDWLRRPLLDADRIAARHDAVAELVERVRLRERVHDRLRDVYDIERLVSRVARRRADARDLRSLAETLAVVPDLREALSGVDCERLASLRASLDELEDVRRLIEESVQEDPDRELTDGGIIRLSYDDELAMLRETEREGKAWIDDLEQHERERTGIDSLKVGHNAVHGYYIEVTEANLDRVPDDYERRQTLKSAERYYTPELKQREDEILGAESRADDLEYELFSEIRGDVAAESARLQALAEALATLDVLVSFGTVAAEYGYTRPTVVPPDGDVEGVHVEGGRHPVVERTQDSFVPNDAHLGADRRLAVITGPNMSGKSTYMRQVALIVVLAQAGSFVPASSARLSVIDRVFTRVGASDDIAGGRSTFMIEMTELAEILERADDRSLVILDEVGRGTSTADGLAIARAVTEYLHDEVGAFTLFATHHHDLTTAAARLDRAVNLHFRTSHEGGDVAFEHAVETGVAAASYGVEVAATAGLPGAVVERARECLVSGAADEADAANEPEDAAGGGDSIDAVSNGHPSGEAASGESVPDRNTGEALPADVRATLDEVDIANTTPLEAMNVLAALKRRVNR